MPYPNAIERFFKSLSFGVAGASADRSKYGNKVLRAYLEHHLIAYPINPSCEEVEGLSCLHTVEELPSETKSLSIVTPPNVTEQIVRQAVRKGIQNIWMQPGAESDEAVRLAKESGMNVIADGSCVLVVLPQFF